MRGIDSELFERGADQGDPQAWRAGHDPQLEKAVAVVVEELKKPGGPKPKRPAYQDYHRTGSSEKEGLKKE